MPQLPLKPFWVAPDGQACKLYHGDVVSVLKRLPARSVHCCVTSPPYWGLRNYGVEGQIGAERTPEEFVAKMVEVFAEVHRVLRDDATLWLNLGDTYGNNGNLVGIPWRTALALQAWGWVLRQDIIWAKPAPMPESVKNRCTKSHEYIFLLTKGQRYYYDAEAIHEKSTSVYKSEDFLPDSNKDQLGDASAATMASRANGSPDPISNGRNKRSVWTVSSQGYEGAHFAVFPPKLITPCVLAGTSEKGCCAACGASWKRVVEVKRSESRVSGGGNCIGKQKHTDTVVEQQNNYRQITGTSTLGWEPVCDCGAGTVPCTILDPFMGSGTAAAVALEYGRRAVGIDLSEKYLRANAIPRIYETLTGNPAYRGMVKPKMPIRVV